MQLSKPAVQRRNAASTFLGEHGCHPCPKIGTQGQTVADTVLSAAYTKGI